MQEKLWSTYGQYVSCASQGYHILVKDIYTEGVKEWIGHLSEKNWWNDKHATSFNEAIGSMERIYKKKVKF